MNDDHYVYDENKYRLVGKQSGKIYQIGDKVKIVVNSVDLLQYKIDFVFL
jgi:exoribonuclease R